MKSKVRRRKEAIGLNAFLHRKNRSPQSRGSPLPLSFNIRLGALIHKDVKNEGASGDMYENKGKPTKCTPISSAFYNEIHQSFANQAEIGRTI